MSQIIIYLILIWIVLSAIMVLLAVAVSSRISNEEMGLNYQESFEEVEDENDALFINDPCSI